MSAFVDSSVWFAAAAKRDAQSERAKSILQSIDDTLRLTWCWSRRASF